MHSDRRKNAFLAINAILRGLELDQISFHYDELGRREPEPDAASGGAHRDRSSSRSES